MEVCRMEVCLALLVFASCYTHVLCSIPSSILVPPSNTAAQVSEPSTIHCTVDQQADTLQWIFCPNGTSICDWVYLYDGSYEDTTAGYHVDPAHRDQGIFDLTIEDSSPSSAGRYECTLLYTKQKETANFVSLDPVTCDPPPGEKEIMEGGTVILTCDVMYVGYKPPALQWTSALSTSPLQGEWSWNYERSTFYANVTAEPDLDGLDFVCDLAFVSEPGDTTAPPVYNDTCTTHFLVLHGATKIEIVPDPDGVVNMEIGETINCSASGRPYPDFMWQDEIGAIFPVSSLEILPEWSEMYKTFTCTASNDVNGQPFASSQHIDVYVVTPTGSPVVETSGVEPWVIAVAVIVPLLIIGGITGGVIAYTRHKKKKGKKKQVTYAKTASDGGPMGPGVAAHPAGHRPGNGPPPGHPLHQQQRPPYQNAAVVAGTPVDAPPGSAAYQAVRKGRDSPGYGDLGIKHFAPENALGVSMDSVEFDPDPRRDSRPGSRHGSTHPQMRGSQTSLSLPAPSYPPPQPAQHDYPGPGYETIPLQPPPNGEVPLGNHPQMVHSQNMANQNMANQNMANQNMANQRPPMMHSNSQMGSQYSLSNMQAARSMMGSQHSLSNMQAARGMMGSRGSLASQGSRSYGNTMYQLPSGDVPDTTV